MSSWFSRKERISSGQPDGALPATGRQRAADRIGLRRVDWVRISVDGSRGPVRAEAMGVGHRLPLARPVTMALAAELIASGTPSVVRRLGPRS
jgi:hypothetical protein